MSEVPERHSRARIVFEHVLSLPPAAQADALAAACAGDAALQQEVARLLSAAAKAGSFLEGGAVPALAERASLIGRRIGSYQIQAAIGVGGMGQVYRAHDTTLGRDVALKILPDVFATDPERLTRFRREAHVLASLNHPHIGAIYGFEESGGVRALVLELIDGPTLADRIRGGPLPLDESLRIARQIVDALAAAHGQGLIHRDLKPANIKLRPDGTVKVLDFGLAKAVDRPSVPSDVPPVPTGSGLTHVGAILGTAPYMSPEQATGRAADERSDIWAFGCVVFEMLTGSLAFGGEEVADTVASILTREPDWTLLPAATPSSIRRLLRRCLEKDRARRLADIRDVRLELDENPPEDAGDTVAPPPISRLPRRSWVPWSIAAASLALAAWLWGLNALSRLTENAIVYRSSIVLPRRGAAILINGPTMALSPDGRYLAFIAAAAAGQGQSQLWLRPLDSVIAHPLAGTEGARSPFWSPDGHWIAFVAESALKKIEAAGGPVVTLCGSAWAGGAWSPKGVILFTQSPSRSLAQVAATGGTPSPATTVDDKAGEGGHLFPSFLPDGQHFLYVALSTSGQPMGLYAAALDSATRARLPIETAFVEYSAGFLWFGRGSTLMAQPFDAGSRTLLGDAVPIAEQVRTNAYMSFFSASPSGALVFQTDPAAGNELTWFDRTGRPTGSLGTRDDYADLSLSPDGRRALVSVGELGTNNRDLWMFDIARGVRTRFTAEPGPETHNAWSPDGTRIVFDTRTPGRFGFSQKRSDGVGPAEVLRAGEFDENPTSWSSDGRFIMYIKRSAGTSNIWVLPLEGDRKPIPITNTQFNTAGTFSPDGRWVAYASTDTGRVEIYAAPFPGPGARTLISTGGGLDPRWRRNGEILYLDVANQKLMSAEVRTDRGRVDVGAVRPLFDLAKVGPRMTYDVSPDGNRILAVTRRDDAGSTALTLVVNWPALLKK